jgi:rod shape-determining protein MreD
VNRKFKIGLFVGLIIGQIILNRYVHIIKLNFDLLYLILVYIAIRSGIVKTVVTATFIGWLTDFFTGGIVGIFGFSRTIIAFFINEMHRYVDLKKNIFVFLLIAISLSISNLIANVFFHFIYGYNLDLNLILRQPFITGILGTLLIIPTRVKEYLDVH